MYKNILIPVAFGHEEERAIAVAKKLLATGGKITLLNVVEEIPAYVSPYLPAGTLEKNTAEALAGLEKIAAKSGADCSAIVTVGHPSQEILDHAGKHDAQCIVISSHKPGLEDYFLGSTAARIVRHAQCCVHVMR